MSENLRRYTRALFALDAVVRRVPADAWDNASCCEGWTARDVANHAVGAIGFTGQMIDARSPDTGDGAPPAERVGAAVDAVLEALDHPGVLHKQVSSRLGDHEVDTILETMYVDAMVHAWDIADAAGIAHGIDPALAMAGLASLQARGEGLRAPGRFSDEVASTSDDPVAQLIAYSGRRSVRA